MVYTLFQDLQRKRFTLLFEGHGLFCSVISVSGDSSVTPLSGRMLYYLHELSGDPNPQYFLKSTAVQMGGVLPYKWEVFCWVPFLQGLEARKVQRYRIAEQIGGVLPYRECGCRALFCPISHPCAG